MRLKQLWNYVPLPATLRLMWDRITFSRLTVAYFVFSVVHFVIQLSLQSKAFTINADATAFLNNIVIEGQAISHGLPFLRDSTLYMCSWVPSSLDVNKAGCLVAWNGTKGVNVVGPQPGADDDAALNKPASLATLLGVPLTPSISVSDSLRPASVAGEAVTPPSPAPTAAATALPQPTGTEDLGSSGRDEGDHPDDYEDDDDDKTFSKRSNPQIMAFQDGDQVKVNISGMGFNKMPATLDKRCLSALNWPVSVLHDTKREDIVFIAFQFWVLGMSVVAILNESIPHVLASLVTHLMATSWAAFQITSTANFRKDFGRVITNGACSGVSLLPRYWHDRGDAEIPSLALNVFTLLVSCFLTWRLIKLFGWQTFKRVGASLTINRVYKIVLILSITIQLCLFFMVVTVSLWIDQLFNSTIGDLADFQKLYKITSFITLFLLVPWLMTGWFAVRRELRVPMFAFLMLSFLYLGGWGVMFFSTTFRWTFVTWGFFGVMACASVFLTVVSFVLGVVCRFNFGKGLLRYLNARQSVPDDDFVYYDDSDIEKVDFPSNEKPVPTYSDTFGSSLEAPPPPNYMFMSRGPRFFNRAASPFETNAPPVTVPPVAFTLTRRVSDESLQGGRVLRSDSHTSDKSIGSLKSFYSYSGHSHTRTDSQPKRWVIE